MINCVPSIISIHFLQTMQIFSKIKRYLPPLGLRPLLPPENPGSATVLTCVHKIQLNFLIPLTVGGGRQFP